MTTTIMAQQWHVNDDKNSEDDTVTDILMTTKQKWCLITKARMDYVSIIDNNDDKQKQNFVVLMTTMTFMNNSCDYQI